MKLPVQRIKEYRLTKNISQIDMAKAAGISRSAYIALEKGDSNNLSLKAAIGIAKALNVSFFELFEIDDSSSVFNQLKVKVSELQKQNDDLQNRLADKELVIKSLSNNRKYFVKSIIRYIEDNPSNSWYWIAKQGYQYANTDEQKKQVEKLIIEAENKRKGMYDFFISEGLMTNDEIDSALEGINASYANIDWKATFDKIFSSPKEKGLKKDDTK